MELYIETRTKNQAYIIDVQGEVDLYSSPTMREYILKTLRQQHPPLLIIELSRVNYMDSSGIATLVEGLQLANEYHIKFRLVGLSPIVLEVFQLARLERVFAIFKTEEEALKDD
ncbi:anti-sigma factor antagonist [Candidatus Vecturithrix granuli]|uniref:Anti-sigma factor antagonist n=1 Tax=Vecturithrix granuli TaxID=1499967 RepID=A0A081C4Z3_VECG1|nr:anti-sigma factor antagonist [Candidatus Vecturithrix granuli]